MPAQYSVYGRMPDAPAGSPAAKSSWSDTVKGDAKLRDCPSQDTRGRGGVGAVDSNLQDRTAAGALVDLRADRAFRSCAYDLGYGHTAGSTGPELRHTEEQFSSPAYVALAAISISRTTYTGRRQIELKRISFPQYLRLITPAHRQPFARESVLEPRCEGGDSGPEVAHPSRIPVLFRIPRNDRSRRTS